MRPHGERNGGWLGAAALSLLVGAAGSPARAEDGEAAQAKPTVRKTAEQLHFELPPDWPVEKRGGMVGPVPVEEYLAMKFKALESRLRTIEQRLSGFDLRLRVIEEAMKSKNPQSGLRSSGTPQP
ncbi:MAG TPA: hypothetical protein VJB16_06980 [archaeon]|nr:hypothetical protein [archaeon]